MIVTILGENAVKKRLSLKWIKGMRASFLTSLCSDILKAFHGMTTLSKLLIIVCRRTVC